VPSEAVKRCLRGSSSNSFARSLRKARTTRGRALERRARTTHFRRAHAGASHLDRVDVFGARAFSVRAHALSPSEKHGETEIKVARVDASSFATGVCEAAARMSANGATTGEGDVRTLWIGDLVRIPSTRLPLSATADASARRASLPPHRTRDRNRDVDATIFLQAFDTPGRRAFDS
jgi:hypothetical protein